MRTAWVATLALALAGAGGLAAQEPTDTSLQKLLERKVSTAHFDVVSSASRFSERTADAPAAVTVITAEDIRRMGAQSIPEALRMVPGLNVREGVQGNGVVTARNEMGTISPRVLVLLDGHPTALEIYSTTMWQALGVTLNQIESIEVVRGPGSTLYGASAYDAVIAVATRKPTGGRTLTASVAGNGAADRALDAVYRQSLGAFRADGYFSSARQSPVDGWQGRTDQKPIPDNYNLSKAGARLGWSTAGGFDAQLSGGLIQGRSSDYFDYSAPIAATDADIRYGYLEVAHSSLPGDWLLRGHLYASHTADAMGGMELGGTKMVGKYVASTYDAELTTGKHLGGHRLLVGAASKRLWSDRLMPIYADPHTQSLYGAFVQDSWELTPYLGLIGGVRYDVDSNNRGGLSPRAALLLKPSEAHTLRISAGKAFRLPTVIESYMHYDQPLIPGLVLTLRGDPKLRPEEITSIEAGYVGAPTATLSLHAAVFHNSIGDAIRITRQYMTVPGVATPIPVAFAFAQLRGGHSIGGEAGAKYLPRDWLRLEANYAHTRLTDSTGAALATTPRHKVNAELGLRPIPSLWLDAVYSYASRIDFGVIVDPFTAQAAGGTTVPARGVVSLNTRLELGGGLATSVLVQNLTDRRYQDLLGGQNLGRRIVGKLEVEL